LVIRLVVFLLLASLSATDLQAQRFFSRRAAACRCEPGGKPRKPRFLLPVAGGLGFLPVSLAARDSLLPSVAIPSLVDIRDDTPRNALEGERALEVGALAPDTATTLPTLMLAAGCLVLVGGYLIIPRRRRRRVSGWRSSGLRRHGGWQLRAIPRRRLGAGLAVGGGLLLVLGFREYAEGAQAQRRARAEWLHVGNTVVRINNSTKAPAPARLAEVDSAKPEPRQPRLLATASAVPLPLAAVSGREIPRGSPVARLSIESIDLDEIVLEGVGPVELNGGPGHFPGSVLPGDAGNSILSAHRDRHFRRVGELGVGAKIRTETRDGTVEWVVTERRIVSKDTPSLFEESEATLTLTTCWPLRYFGPAPDRLLIIAKRAS
jgi:sortase A